MHVFYAFYWTLLTELVRCESRDQAAFLLSKPGPHSDTSSLEDASTNPDAADRDREQPHSWSFRPSCIRLEDSPDPFCVYTDTRFANGRGVSIITTPLHAELFVKSPLFSSLGYDEKPINKFQKFLVKEIPGHGMGAVANQTIFRGDKIMDHTPVLFINDAFWEKFVEEDYLPLLHTAVERLPPTTKALYLNLAVQGEKDAIDDILDTNSFNINLFAGVNISPSSYSILIPEVARLNHDCRPNAAYHFNTETLTHTILALRSIPPEEELTVSYIPQVQPRAVRQSLLHKSWGFHCDCSLCSATPSLISASDSRIHRANELKVELTDYSGLSQTSTGMAELVISLYEQERLWGPICEAYQLAAMEFNGVGDVWGAEKYGRLALEAALVYRGDEHVDVRDLEEFLGDVRGHQSWMFRMT